MKTRHFLMMATLAVGIAMTSMMMTSCAKEDNPIHQPSDTWDAETGTLYVNSNISLLQGEKLNFTSTVGNISQITIQTEPYDEDDEPDAPVAEGWTWDAAKRTFTWQDTPSATVEMLASEEIDLENVQIQFTID